jgi:hypothetical protein
MRTVRNSLAIGTPALLGLFAIFAMLFTQVTAQADPFQPIPNCPGPFAGVVPAGQANPSIETEPMGPIWCFNLTTNRPTTRVTGANDWVDEFDTGVQMGRLNDHDMGYRVIDAFNTDPAFMRQGTFANANHWMVDVANVTQYSLSGGQMFSPDRGFAAEGGVLVIEADVAASTDAMGGANQFVEIDLTSAANINPLNATNATVDALYGYGEFGGVGAMGCRLESGANFVCAMYDDTFHATDGRDVRGGFPSGESGRVWETQGVGNALTAASIRGGYPEFVVAPGLQLRDVWRVCAPNEMDMHCRDRFRMEVTKTSIHLYVNGYGAMFIDGLFASNPEGRDSRIPDSFLTQGRPYFTSWINGGRDQPLTRFHWDRIAVNPHDAPGHLQPPTSAPSFCLGQPMNTCPMVLAAPGLPVPSRGNIEIYDFVFNPPTVTVNVGDTVTWTNLGHTTHSVTSQPTGQFASGVLVPGQTYSVTFLAPGVYSYICVPHPPMAGQVIVLGTGSEPTSGPTSGPSATPTAAVPPTATGVPTSQPSAVPSATAAPSATGVPSPTRTSTPAPTATGIPTPLPGSPTLTATRTATAPIATALVVPTRTPTPSGGLCFEAVIRGTTGNPANNLVRGAQIACP